MNLKDALERIAELEARIKKLEAQPPQQVHYHYPQMPAPVFAPVHPFYPQPRMPVEVWCGADTRLIG